MASAQKNIEKKKLQHVPVLICNNNAHSLLSKKWIYEMCDTNKLKKHVCVNILRKKKRKKKLVL